jgi:hypothetical protein
LESYRASLAIADRLVKADPGYSNGQHDLSVSHNKIGDVLVAQGNLPAALESHHAALAIADRLSLLWSARRQARSAGCGG